jgi:hypothetical protein
VLQQDRELDQFAELVMGTSVVREACPESNVYCYNLMDFHKSPYTTKIDQGMAILSVMLAAYDSRLNTIYSTLLWIMDKQYHVHSLNYAQKLCEMEMEALHQGLHFERHQIHVPGKSLLPEQLQNALYPVFAVMRKDMGAVIVDLVTRSSTLGKLAAPSYEANMSGIYGEISTGKAWEKAQRAIGLGKNIVGLLLFSDSTQILKFDQRSLHPIYIALLDLASIT